MVSQIESLFVLARFLWTAAYDDHQTVNPYFASKSGVEECTGDTVDMVDGDDNRLCYRPSVILIILTGACFVTLLISIITH